MLLTLYKLLYKELHWNKVFLWVPYYLGKQQKPENLKFNKETLLFFNDGDYRIIYKIVAGVKTYLPFISIKELSLAAW